MKLPVFNYSHKIINKQGEESLDVFVDGDIVDAETQEFFKNYFGDETSVSFKSLRNDILNYPGNNVNININSGGGQVADALAMHDFIQEQEAGGRNIKTFGKGIVASAATYPLFAPKPENINVAKNCHVMIHNVSGTVSGTVDEVEAGARMMRKFNNCARDLYAEFFNKPKETIANWMNAETWWSGREMASNGLIPESCVGPMQNVITNKIPAEKWPFSNTAILNTINNSISKPPKNKGMKFKKLGAAVANSVKEMLEKAGIVNNGNVGSIKLEDFEKTLTNNVNNALEEMETELTNSVTESVTNAMSGEGFNKAITNALTEVLKVDKNPITEAITNATSGLVTTEAMEKVKTDLANKLGTTGKPKNKNGKAPKEDDDDSAVTNHPGVRFGSFADDDE